MVAIGSVLRWVCVSMWNESLTLLKANLAGFVVTLPLTVPLLLLLAGVMPPPGPDEPPRFVLPLILTGLLALLLPNPASLGLHTVAAVILRRDSPTWDQFLAGLKGNVRLGLTLFGIGLTITIFLAVDLLFYLGAQPEPVRFVAVLFAYLLLYWLAMQLYLGPLVVQLGERRLLSLYRRAAMLVLAHPLYTLLLLIALLAALLLCLLAVPLYPLFALAFAALTGTGALAQLRRKYDPQLEPDEESA
jgi:uncharacterized membrane protein YesL